MDIPTANRLPPAATNLLAAMSTLDWIGLGTWIGMIAVTVLSIKYWYVAFKRLGQSQEFIAYQRSECVLGFVDLLAIFAIWFGGQMVAGVVLVAVAGRSVVGDEMFAKYGVLLMYLSAAFGIASLLVGAAFLLFRYRTTNSFGLRFNQVRQQVGSGVMVFIMLFPPVMLLQFLLSLLVKYDHPVLTVLAEDPSFVSIFSCWAAAVLAAPFVEEFLFRGVFHHWLERLSISKLNNDQLLLGGANVDESSGLLAKQGQFDSRSIPTAELAKPVGANYPAYDPSNPYQSPSVKIQKPLTPDGTAISSGQKFGYWPILVSSLCFAGIHYGQGLAPIPLFFLALGLGYLFRQTGSLIACITVHFLLNFYGMFMFTVMILLEETP